MGFFSRLFGKKNKPGAEQPEADREEDLLPLRSRIRADRPEERERFVEGCLRQMAEATDVVDKLSGEYNMVTEYLTDMEEIEALPPEERRSLNEDAARLVQLTGESNRYSRRPSLMNEQEFEKMTRFEDSAKEAVEKLAEEEHMRDLIKKDLKRLGGERHALEYRKKELKSTLGNARGMVVIALGAMVVCLVILLILQQTMYMEVRLGMVLSVTLAAGAIAFIFLRFMDARDELFKVENTINRVILLTNRVKIRYVNNQNLLDYLYLKYGVTEGRQLKDLWERYCEEKEERRKYEETRSDLSHFEKQLVKKLNRYPVKYPRIWIHQPLALIDDKEMVEIRHGLITRRQSLRKQIEYNRKLAENASLEIKDFAAQNPVYAAEIRKMVDAYEA